MDQPVARIVRIIRWLGIALGVLAIALGYELLTGERPTANTGLYNAGNAATVGVGVLLMLPWQRVRSAALFWFLWLLLLAGAITFGLFFLGGYVWAAIHGAVRPWENITYLAIAAVLALQFPAVYLVRRF